MTRSRITADLNWRYALGELALIVLGILIALAISDWNDRRVARNQELALLSEVRTTLRADLAEFERGLALLQETVPRIEALSKRLDGPIDDDDAMDRLFGAAYGVHGINLNSTAYETLKSVGLQSISNLELRQRLTRVFDHFYEQVLIQRDIETGVTLNVMRPYYLSHFRELRFLESATPIDFGAVVADPYYRNIVDYRLEVLRSNQLKTYPEVIGEIGEALRLLDEELGARS